jgi:ABC-type branched-subunit amino acid transport system ATPase component
MGLDPRTRRAVFASIRTINEQGRTILLVEQNARAGLRLSSRGVVLENGAVRLSGTGREVLDHPEIGALYLGLRIEPAGVLAAQTEGSVTLDSKLSDKQT